MKKRIFILLVTLVVMISGMMVVNAATPDTKPPVLKSISLKNPKSSYNTGDEVYFNLDLSDDISGVEFVKITICLYDENFEENGMYPCKGNSASNRTDLEVYDFPNNTNIYLPDYIVKGKYVVESVWTCDKRSHCADYSLDAYAGYSEGDEQFFFELKHKVFFNVNSDKDYAPDYQLDSSSIKSITLDKNTIKPGEKIKVTGVATDEHVSYMSVDFHNTVADTWMFTDMQLESAKDGEYTFVGYLDCPYKNGNYKLDTASIMMNDVDGRHGSGISVGYERFNYTISVSGNKTETPNFKLNKVIYDKKTLIAPSTYKISLNVTDSSGLANIANVMVLNKKNNTQWLSADLIPDKNGNFTGYFDIDQFTAPGEYYIYSIDFGFREPEGYWSSDHIYDVINENIKYEKDIIFEVVDSDFYDVVTSTTDKYLVKKIKEANKSAKIGINATDDSIIKDEVFEAIKGTNKTIYIESNGIQWIFNGKNIKKSKDVDTRITLSKIDNDVLKEKIGNFLDKGIIVNFKDNGELPGVALVKIKTDYALRDYLGTQNLQIYHYNGSSSQMFDEIVSDISITKDYDLEFYITHNSSYVISNKKVDDKLVSNDKEIKEINEKKLTNNDDDSFDKDSSKVSSNKLFLGCVIATPILVVAIIVLLCILRKRNKKNKETDQVIKSEEKKEEVKELKDLEDTKEFKIKSDEDDIEELENLDDDNEENILPEPSEYLKEKNKKKAGE